MSNSVQSGSPTSCLGLLQAQAMGRPDAIAFRQQDMLVTYGELWRLVENQAGQFADSGVHRGEIIALEFPTETSDSLASLAALYALGWLGAVVLPLYPGLPRARRRELVELFGARLLPVPIEHRRITAIPVRQDLPGQPWLFTFSSGTTGPPKACLQTHGQMADNVINMLSIFDKDFEYCLLTPQVWPTKVALRDILKMHGCGGTVVNHPFPRTRAELATQLQLGVNGLTASPWQIRVLLEDYSAIPEPGPPPLHSLTIVGASLFRHEIDVARRVLSANVWSAYGCTEIGVIAGFRHGDVPLGEHCVGQLVPGIEGRAMDEAMRPLPAGEVGLLAFRASWVADGYFNNADATAERFHDGWFLPGDRGYVDADGFVVLQGRSDDVINHGGVMVVPGDVELVLTRHPDIADAIALGVPDAQRGEIPVAFIVARRPIEAKELISFCAEFLPMKHIPREIILQRRLDRKEDGKPDRERLRRRYLKKLARRAGSPGKGRGRDPAGRAGPE